MIKEPLKKNKIGIVKKEDISKNQVKTAYLAIGSNIGSRVTNINIAKYKLQLHNIKISESSSNYESLSWPNPKYPKFINIVLKVETFLNEKKLLLLCNKIEKDLGRLRVKKNEPRICDIDIIDYNGKVCNIKGKNFLNLPHPAMSKRNFVLLPLYEISKRWKHPQSKISILKLINQLKINDLRAIKQI